MIPASPIRFVLPDLECTGVLLEVNGSNVQVEFMQEHELALALGSHHPVRMVREPSGHVLSAEATTVFRQEDSSGSRRYGFELDLDLEQELHPRDSRRGGYRVASMRGSTIPIQVRPPGQVQALVGEVNNLSAVGVLVSLPPEADEELAQHERIHLQFRLPGGELDLRLNGLIRHRRLGGGKMQLGIEYESRDMPRPIEQELTNYVMRRQLHQLRRRSPA